MLVLFDIDGTLLKRVHPEGQRPPISLKEEAFMRMVKELWSAEKGFYTRVIGTDLRGMTDMEIVLELTGRMGIARSEVLEKMDRVKETLIKEFDALEAVRGSESDYEVLPGVEQLLRDLDRRGVKLGIATGNLKHFAVHKLKLLGLDRFFTVGGFGDNYLRRREIVAEAVSDGCETESYLVGDTPRDILAAQACNIGVVAVATGGHSFEELASYSPGLVVKDLTDKEEILEYLGLLRSGR